MHVSADLLAAEDVPAGTPADLQSARCSIDGVGPVEPETARRLACDRPLLGAVVDAHGDVLALGRTRRLVSRAQRRALMIRDGRCRFPGCAQTRHLDAHHAVRWSARGSTDLDNLVLLCSWHHTAVHEGGVGLRRQDGRWRFLMPDGSDDRPWYSAEALPELLRQQDERARRERVVDLAAVDGFEHPAARTIRPGWCAEVFDLGECVRVLFELTVPPQEEQVLAA